MFLGRLFDVIDTWLSTGRFPREEFRVRKSLAIPFAVLALLLAAAFIDRLLAG
jgi:hypothetical protein